MNKKISAGTAAIVIVVALAICGFVYSQIPTGMVVHTTGRMGKKRPSGPSMMRNRPAPQRAPHGIPQKAGVHAKANHTQKAAAKDVKGTGSIDPKTTPQ